MRPCLAIKWFALPAFSLATQVSIPFVLPTFRGSSSIPTRLTRKGSARSSPDPSRTPPGSSRRFLFFVFLIERDGGSLAWAIELLILTSWVRIQPRTVLLYYSLQKLHQWRVPLKGSEQPILMDQLFPKIVPFYLYRALTKKRSTFVPRVNQFSQLVNSQICHFRYYTADYCWLEHWYLCISFSIIILYLLQSNTFLTAPSSGLL